MYMMFYSFAVEVSQKEDQVRTVTGQVKELQLEVQNLSAALAETMDDNQRLQNVHRSMKSYYK